jgi:hypothetical protein
MWVAKPLYELLPYYYVIGGALAFAVAAYVDSWYWSPICIALGASGIIGGLVVLLKRRGYRASRSRVDFEKTR